MPEIKRILTPKEAGEAAELVFMARAAGMGLAVSKPLGHNSPYDVVVEADRRLLRIQVKSSACECRGRCFRFQTLRRGCFVRGYEVDEFEFLAAYVRPLDVWYIIPVQKVYGRQAIEIYPWSGSGRFERYRESWDLLLNVVEGEEGNARPAGVELRKPKAIDHREHGGHRGHGTNVPTLRRTTRRKGGAPTGNGQRETGNELSVLNSELIACTRCPRLVEFREQIGREKRRAYMECEYWARPVPGFGDPEARVLLLGLAPGAHGSNRTGRMFTGDASGRFLFDVLHTTGFASQPTGIDRDDGLTLTDCYITAAVRCVPPGNKPTPEEIATCAQYLDRELALLPNVRVVVGLGKIGFDAYLNHLRRHCVLKNKGEYVFGHGKHYQMPDGRILLASYHPSNQNTQTGKLTREMFMDIFHTARSLADAETSASSVFKAVP